LTTHGAHATAPANQQPSSSTHRSHPPDPSRSGTRPDTHTRHPIPTRDPRPRPENPSGDPITLSRPNSSTGVRSNQCDQRALAQVTGRRHTARPHKTLASTMQFTSNKQPPAQPATRHPHPSPQAHTEVDRGSGDSRYDGDRHRPQGTSQQARSLRTQQCAQTTRPRHNHVPTPTQSGRY
jgi:hypothetical protein